MPIIYIVEDDKNISEIEAIALQNSGYETVQFVTVAEFEEALKKEIPDLVILDIMLPDGDGNRVVTRLRESSATKKLPVIMVTAKTTDADLAKGLNTGADDYIKKPFSVLELVSRVGALLRRTDKQKETSLTIGKIVIDKDKRKVFISDEEAELTYKEFELLVLLMTNSQTVLSRERIMSAVWGYDFAGESRTLDMHINSLRKKLKDEGNRIKTIRNVGYIIE